MKKISAGIAVLALAGCVSNDTPVNAKPTAASTADRNLVAATIAQKPQRPGKAPNSGTGGPINFLMGIA